MITIKIRKPFSSLLSKKEITSSLSNVIAVLYQENLFDWGILICSDFEIQVLNQQFRQIDQPTDVLSFGSDEIDPETQSRYLGDVIVSYETALKQSIIAGHGVQTEIIILVIHGLLHLLGYDHDSAKSKQEMWNKQFEAHRLLGIKIFSLSGEND